MTGIDSRPSPLEEISPAQAASARPVVFSYCATFLPPEMLHVYRQVSGIAAFENWVVTRRRQNPDRFPYPRVVELRKSPWRWLARIYHRSQGARVPVSRAERRHFLQLAAERRPALLHVYLGTEALRVIEVLEHFPGARIVSFHGADLSNDLDRQSYQRLWSCAELFLSRSDSLRRDLLALGCPAERIRLNFTGVPLSAAATPRVLPRWRQGEVVRAVQACRLIAKKGLEVTLEAISLLQQAGVPIELTLAGDGPERVPLERRSAELSWTRPPRWVGFLTEEQLMALYAESHLFLHPSRTTSSGDREGIPNSLLEAMASGLGVVSTRHSGIPEAVEHGVSGWLIEEARTDALTSAIQRILDDPEQFQRVTAGAIQRIGARFSTARCVDALEAAYREAAAMRPGAS